VRKDGGYAVETVWRRFLLQQAVLYVWRGCQPRLALNPGRISTASRKNSSTQMHMLSRGLWTAADCV